MAEPNKEVKNLYNMEQGISLNGYFDVDIDGEVKSIQITIRNGMTAEQAVTMTETYIETYRQLRQKYPKSDKPVEKPEEVKSDKKPYEPKSVPVGELPEELPTSAEGGATEYFKDEFDEILIEPQPDDKCTVSFFKDKMKYPVGARINKWKNENVAKALAALGDIDPSKPAKIRVAGVQYWTKGSEYIIANGAHKGEKSHYKDLRLIQALL